MSLRWRLTLLYAALLGLTLLLAASLSYSALRSTLYDGLDQTLRRDAEFTAAQHTQPALEPPPEVAARLDELNRRQPIRITVFDDRGQEIDWGPSRVGFTAPQVRQVGGERVYMLKTGVGWVQVTQSDAELRAALSRMLRLYLLGLPLLLLLSLGVGYALADRALRPVDQVSDLAARIARSGQPGERVPLAPGRDELARLTRTFNEMLGRLDGQLTRERLFAHSSAHELRTPIAVIRAATSLALEQERTPEQYRETLEQVQDVSEDMSALTARLMSLAQATRLTQRREVNLADVTLMTAETHAQAAQQKGIQLDVNIQDAATLGDYNALVLAAGNLLQNAIKYSPEGSTVSLSCAKDGETARLSVQDAGPGIPEADRLRLVQPFQRGPLQDSTQGRSGAGLGLALVEAIMDAHEGRLELSDGIGGGLKAELVLPAALL